MKFLIPLLLFFSFSVFGKTIVLKTGESQFLPSKGTAWVENSKAIKILQKDSGFAIKGVRAGSSLVKIGKNVHIVHVISPLHEKTILRLGQALKKTLGLSQEIQDGKVRVTGRLLRWEDWEIIYDHCSPNYCDFEMVAKIDSAFRARLERSFYRKLKTLGLPPQPLLIDNGIRVLIAKKTNQLARIQATMKSFGIEAQVIDSAVEMSPLVKVQITVAEVKRSETLKYGIQWPASYSAQILPKYMPSQENQFLTVQALENQGLAKVLATPTLLCRSGKEASFLAGI